MLSGRGDARGPKEFRASVARQVIVNLIIIRSDYAYRTIIGSAGFTMAALHGAQNTRVQPEYIERCSHGCALCDIPCACRPVAYL